MKVNWRKKLKSLIDTAFHTFVQKTPPTSYVWSFCSHIYSIFLWSRLVLGSCWFVLTRVGLMLVRVDVLIRVRLVLIQVDLCWFVLTRADLCWYLNRLDLNIYTCFKLSIRAQKQCHIFSIWTTFNNPCSVLIANF